MWFVSVRQNQEMFWQTAVYTFIVMFTWIQLLYSHHDSEDKLLSSSVFFVIPNKPSLVSGSEAAKLESEVSRENAALRYLAICVPQEISLGGFGVTGSPWGCP